MRVLAELITPWVGTGAEEVRDRVTGEILQEEDPYRPKFLDDYTATFSDTTSQPAGELPPKPNIYVIWVNIEDTILDTVEGDPTYYILWREDNADAVPPANEFGQLRSFLSQAGVDQAEIDEAIGGSVGGRTRTEIVEEMKEWMRTLHKAP